LVDVGLLADGIGPWTGPGRLAGEHLVDVGLLADGMRPWTGPPLAR
jgi:hypothetical protein